MPKLTHRLPARPVTIAELVNEFRKFAEARCRHPDGDPTGEADNYRFAAQHLLALYADTPAAEFGPRALKAVRRHLIHKRLARTVINRTVNRLKYIFQRAVED